MKKLRKLDFAELTQSELRQITGGDDNTRKGTWDTSSPTSIAGITNHSNGTVTTDAEPDTEILQDYELDYA